MRSIYFLFEWVVRYRVFKCLTSWACMAAGVALLMSAGSAAAKDKWPRPQLPEKLETFSIADSMTIDGTPMRIQGFVSTQSTAELLAALRRSLGQPLVESQIGPKHILGRVEGSFYVSVQVEPADNGSCGVVAVADIDASIRHREKEQAEQSRLLDRLPAGSTINSRMTTLDGAQAGRHIVITNRVGEARNEEALVSMMKRDGLALETASRNAHPKSGLALADGPRALFFKGSGKEATAIIVRHGDMTSIVLNMIENSRGAP